MSDGSIKIIVGASASREIETVFGGIEKRAEKAGKNIAKSLGTGLGGSGGSGRSFDGLGKSAEQAGKQVENSFSNQAKAADKAMRAEERASQQAARARVRAEEQASRSIISEFKRQTRERAKELRAQEQAEEKAAKKTERFAHNASRYALRNVGSTFSHAARFGSDILRGAGIDMSIGSLVQRTAGIESAAVGLSSRGHIEGAKGANGQVVSSVALEGEARKAGLATAVNPEEILGAGRAFVGLTGDLDLWRKIMPQVVKQTAALGGNQEDAARAAGEFAAHVGDIPNKEKAIMNLMAVAAGQGKIGGVDFSDFAKYASRAAAPAAMYAGDKAQNIGKLTALAEISKMHGGSANAAEAFQSITQFSNTLKKSARTKTIAKLIGNKDGQFTDSQHSDLRGVNEIIKDLIWGSAKDIKNPNGPRVKASQTAISTALGDVRGTRAINGLIATFNEAGGGAKGMAAVEAELKKFDGAVMSAAEIERANAANLATTKSQTELFNQGMESVTHGLMAELGPALRDMTPNAIGAAHGLGQLASWAVKNPWTAVGAGVGTAVAKGMMESALRASMEDLMTGSVRAGVALGGLGIAVAGAIYAMKLISDDVAEKEKEQNKDAVDNANAGILEGDAAKHAKNGTFSSKDRENLEAIDSNLYSRITGVNKLKQSNPDYASDGAATIAYEAAFDPDKAAARQDAAHIDELKNELENNRRILAGVLRVEVMNPNDIGASTGWPKVDGAPRSPNPGLPPRWN